MDTTVILSREDGEESPRRITQEILRRLASLATQDEVGFALHEDWVPMASISVLILSSGA